VRAAACRTRWNGASVEAGRPASTALFDVRIKHRLLTMLAAGAQPRLNSRGGPRFGSQHWGACATRQAKGRAGCWVQKGVAPSRCRGPGYHPGKFLKTQMLNPAFWRLLAVKFFCFLKTTAKKLRGPIHCWSPNLKS